MREKHVEIDFFYYQAIINVMELREGRSHWFSKFFLAPLNQVSKFILKDFFNVVTLINMLQNYRFLLWFLCTHACTFDWLSGCVVNVLRIEQKNNASLLNNTVLCNILSCIVSLNLLTQGRFKHLRLIYKIGSSNILVEYLKKHDFAFCSDPSRAFRPQFDDYGWPGLHVLCRPLGNGETANLLNFWTLTFVACTLV